MDWKCHHVYLNVRGIDMKHICERVGEYVVEAKIPTKEKPNAIKIHKKGHPLR